MKKSIFITLMVFLLLALNGHADHIAGADLSYACLGGNQYQINLNLYVDCNGISEVKAEQKIEFSSSCGNLPSIQLNLTNPGGTEISQVCPSQLNNSRCNGGSLPGMRAYHYTGTVTISQACNPWIISWGLCCRNAAISNLQTTSYGIGGIFLETVLNNATSICNNSPSFTAQPIPYFCVNQIVNYNLETAEPDGDSLHFSLANAMAIGIPKTLLPYANGYSDLSPIPGITIDHRTGQLNFIPTTIGNFVVAVLVQEYSGGSLVGSVTKDMQFVVQSCPNTPPDPAGTILTVEKATQTGIHAIETCEGSSFSFKTKYTDTQAKDALVLSSDITTLLTGSTITTTGLNPVIATINWTPPPGSAGTHYTFKITIDDGSCPVPAKQSYSYTVSVLPPCPVKDTSMLFTPNIFTPGGLNPVFKISTYGIMEYRIQIFDRWGGKVFESTDINTHWDGNNVSDGTYYYMIKAEGVDQKSYDRKGFVQRLGAN